MHNVEEKVSTRRSRKKWYENWPGPTVASFGFGLLVGGARWAVASITGNTTSLSEVVWAVTAGTIFGLVLTVRSRIDELELDVKQHNGSIPVMGETDRLLLELQTRLKEVQLHRSAVFKTYCQEELARFVRRVGRAAQQGELSVREHHFRTMEDVLDAFGPGEDNRVYRAVWKIGAEEKLFDTAWQHYLRELIELTQERTKEKRVRIKMLIVVDGTRTMEREAVRVMLGYLKARKKEEIEYRVIEEQTYNELMEDAGLNTRYEDFGVYGNALLYRTETYEPKRGTFSEDKTEIDAYAETHEAAMARARPVPEPPDLLAHNDIKRFLTADDAEETAGGGRGEGTTRGELVKIRTADDQILDGLLYTTGKAKAAVIHIHGSLGNFYNQKFIPIFAEAISSRGVNFLSVNLRAHDGIAEGYDVDGEMEYVGGSIIPFETCLTDIEAARTWVENKGWKTYLQGHSMGCDRVLYYLEQTKAQVPAILLSPCDSKVLQEDWKQQEREETNGTESATKTDSERRDRDGPWRIAPKDAYGVIGEGGWTYSIPITETVLKSILEGPVGRLLAIDGERTRISAQPCVAYVGTEDPIRGTSMNKMKEHVRALLPEVTFVERPTGHNMEDYEAGVAEQVADWISKQEERGETGQ